MISGFLDRLMGLIALMRRYGLYGAVVLAMAAMLMTPSFVPETLACPANNDVSRNGEGLDDDSDDGEPGPDDDPCKGKSSNPVYFYNGQKKNQVQDLPLTLGDQWFGHTRYFHNRLSGDYEGRNGHNWLILQQPYIAWDDRGGGNEGEVGPEDVFYVFYGRTSPIVLNVGGSVASPTFTPRNDPMGYVTFTEMTGTDRIAIGSNQWDGYRLSIDLNGAVYNLEYFGFDGAVVGNAETKAGVMYRHVDRPGQADEIETIVASFDGQKPMLLVREIGNVTYRLAYHYYDANHQLQSVTMIKWDDANNNSLEDAGEVTNLRRVSYTYYEGGETHGSTNNMKTATVERPNGSSFDDVYTTYYRYYKDADTNGSDHQIKMIFGPESYRLLNEKAVQMSMDIDSVPDTTADDYADYYFEYDSSNRITKEVVRSGCGGCGGSAGTDGETLTYVTNPNTTYTKNYNHWRTKATLTKAGGEFDVVFTNHVGNIILTSSYDSTGNILTRRYTHYNSVGKPWVIATSPAIKASDPIETNDDVVDWNGGSSSLLKQSEGLVYVKGYGASTTATETTPGDVKDYLAWEGVREGADPNKLSKTESTLTLTRELTYFKKDPLADGATFVYPVAQAKTYITDDGTRHATTEYEYAYHTNSTQLKERLVKLPAVPLAQNGENVVDQSAQYYDAQGNMTWSVDVRGLVTYHEYDPATELRTRTILDPDTSSLTPPTSAFAGISYANTGDHLVTTYKYDGINRLTRVLGPEHEVDLDGDATKDMIQSVYWTVYDEKLPTEKDEVRMAQGYKSGTSYTLINPVSIRVASKDGRQIHESIAATRTSTSGELLKTDTFTQSDYVAWSVNTYSIKGDMTASKRYFEIPSTGSGALGTNYLETLYAYDDGKPIQVTAPDGTINYMVYDDQDRVIESWVGTDATGATQGNPEGSGTNNLKKVSSTVYDNATGNRTQQTVYISDTVADNRITDYVYDFRNRLIEVSGEEDTYIKFTLDNLGRATTTQQLDGSATGTLLTKSTTDYDDRGRAYKTTVYEVNAGAQGQSLVSQAWYDASGRTIKSHSAGGEVFSKITYDILGRATARYTAYDTDESSYAEAEDVMGDVVLTQVEYAYNEIGQPLLVTHRDRLHDTADSQTGLLNNQTTAPQARVSYAATWYDGAGRAIASANYGTNAGSSLTRPDTAPDSSDTVLVSTVAFDDIGRTETVTNPAGQITKFHYDDLGRRIATIENYKAGSTYWTNEPLEPKSRDADINRITANTYDSIGHMTALTAIDPDHDGNTSDNQVTTYVYGTDLVAGSDLHANSLLTAIIYPESDDVVSTSLTNGSDTTYDRIEITYNRVGQTTQRKDQRGVIHQYEYDHLGRLTNNKATTITSGVDSTVRALARTYTDRGQIQTITSYSDTTLSSVVNQVAYTYNGFGQLTHDKQDHDSVIDGTPGSSGGATQQVVYAYEDGSDDTQEIRLKSMTYPDGREIHYLYDSGIDHNISRVSSIANAATSPTLTYASYDTRGSGALAIKTLGTTTPIDLDYVGSPASSDAGYAHLDRFGRITSQSWQTSANADRLVIHHGYDRASNRLYAEHTTDGTADLDEFYRHDSLNRLVGFQRGDLNGSLNEITTGNLEFEQDWTLTQTGNWSTFTQDDNGDGSNELDQTRTHNTANEIVSIDATSGGGGGSGGNWYDPTHDAAGNMASGPAPGSETTGHTYTYDAWNRLVKIEDTSGGDTIAEYSYDGTGRRITKKVYAAGIHTHTDHFYYSPGGHSIVEIRQATSGGAPGTPAPGSGGIEDSDPREQYVWGLMYIDELVACIHDDDLDGTTTTHFALHNTSFNVEAMVDSTGNIVERYRYTPYGERTILDANFAEDADGLSDIDFAIGHQGLYYDAESGLWYNRARMLNPATGRFQQRDPLGYVDGMSVYTYYAGLHGALDPSGLATWKECCPEAFDWLEKIIELFESYSDDYVDASADAISTMGAAKFVYESLRAATNEMIDHLEGLSGVFKSMTGDTALEALPQINSAAMSALGYSEALQKRANGRFAKIPDSVKSKLKLLGKLNLPGLAGTALSNGLSSSWDLRTLAGEMENASIALSGASLMVRALVDKANYYQGRADELREALDQLGDSEYPPDGGLLCDKMIAAAKMRHAQVEGWRNGINEDINEANKILDELDSVLKDIYDNAGDIIHN